MNAPWRVCEARRSRQTHRPSVSILWFAAGLSTSAWALSAVDISPTADGTLADGGPFGMFDGIVDTSDWSFNESSFEGAITLTKPMGGSPGLQQRVVWEYRMPTSFAAPVTATLELRLRGVPRFPDPPTDVHVYAYSADAAESPSDFSIPVGALVGSISVAPYQAPTNYVLDVSKAVSDILRGGADAVGFRFQVDPLTTSPANQAFVDALDSDPATKPTLRINTAVPGDSDNDSDVDLIDFKAMAPCVHGPGSPVSAACRKFDLDLDRDVDLGDFEAFEYFLGFFGQ